jgi:Cu(I)/Ag(I) efflux system membrane protein CusA/SilA
MLVGPRRSRSSSCLLYLTFRRFDEAAIVMASLPFALTGGIWLVYLLGYDFSVAVAVGFIALAGLPPSSASSC